MSEANKTLYLSFIREVLNAGELSRIAQYTAPEFLDHRYPDRVGVEGSIRTLTDIRAAFPDINFTPEDVICRGRPCRGAVHYPRYTPGRVHG